MTIERSSVERMLHATRPGRADREHHERRDEQDPDHAHGQRDGDSREHRNRDVERPDGNACDAGAFLVDHHADEWAIEKAYGRQPHCSEGCDQREIRPRDGQDRAEQVLEEIDVEGARAGDEHDTERNARIEDERERLVAGRPTARAEELDGDAAENGGDERS